MPKLMYLCEMKQWLHTYTKLANWMIIRIQVVPES